MYCTKCGASYSDAQENNFCTKCGEKLPRPNSKYWVYIYDKQIAKENKAYTSILIETAKGCGYIMIPMLVFMFISFIWDWMMILGIISAGIGLVALICECVIKSKYINAAQSVVVLDFESNTEYYVTFLGNTLVGWNTASRLAAAVYNVANAKTQSELAKMHELAIKEVERYRAGENRFNIWTGGDVKVTELRNATIIKQCKQYTAIEYTDRKGRRKTFKKPNAFK